MVARLHGLYDRDEERADHPTIDDVVGVFHLVTICTWLLFAAPGHRPRRPGARQLLGSGSLAICSSPPARALARAPAAAAPRSCRTRVIVGAGDVGQLIARKLIRHPEYGINVVGFVDAHPKVRRADLPRS